MDKKRDWLEFILTSFGVAFHGGLFRDIHFIGPLFMQAHYNLINTFSNKYKLYFISSFFNYLSMDI